MIFYLKETISNCYNFLKNIVIHSKGSYNDLKYLNYMKKKMLYTKFKITKPLQISLFKMAWTIATNMLTF